MRQVLPPREEVTNLLKYIIAACKESKGGDGRFRSNQFSMISHPVLDRVHDHNQCYISSAPFRHHLHELSATILFSFKKSSVGRALCIIFNGIGWFQSNDQDREGLMILFNMLYPKVGVYWSWPTFHLTLSGFVVGLIFIIIERSYLSYWISHPLRGFLQWVKWEFCDQLLNIVLTVMFLLLQSMNKRLNLCARKPPASTHHSKIVSINHFQGPSYSLYLQIFSIMCLFGFGRCF